MFAAACFAAVPASAVAAGPSAIAVDDAGTSYVGFPSGAVARYRLGDGQSLGAWSTQVADADGRLGPVMAMDVAPAGASLNGGNVWILDANRRVQEFTRSGGFVRGFRLDACDGSNDPQPGREGGIDVTADAVYVAHPCGDRIHRYALAALPAAGTSAAVPAATQGVYAPHGIAAQTSSTAPVQTRHLYVAQSLSSVVRQFDPTSLAEVGDAPGGHSGRYDDVFIDVTGLLFVVESNDIPGYDDRIFQYDASGAEVVNIGGPGALPGLLNDPRAFDVFPQTGVPPSGNVFIADTGNERIQRMTDDGFTFWAVPAGDPGPPPAPPQVPPTGGGDGGGGGGGGATTLPAAPGGGGGAAGAAGITIDDGARFTNSPYVDLTVREPAGTTAIEISNGAEFAEKDTRSVRSTLDYEWTLDESGSDLSPRKVYARFPGSADERTYSDEITLDRRAPLVGAATIARKRSRGGKRRRWILRVAADDEISGLAELHTARGEDGAFRERPFASKIKLKRAKRARFVRVTDLAGNATEAVAVKRRKR